MANAAAIAAALHVSERAIHLRAAKEGWSFEEEKLAGGGKRRLFRDDQLPATVQRALGIAVTNLPARVDAADLKDHQRRRMEARASVLALVDHYVSIEGMTRAKAIEAVVARARARTLPPLLQDQVGVANARANDTRTLTRATLFNWLKARDRANGDVVGLATSAPAESPPPAWASTFMQFYGRPSKPNLTDVLAAWPAGEPAPTYDQARRFLKRLDAVTRNAGRLGPRALKSLKAYTIRDVSNLWPGAVFIGDGHTFKAEVAHPIHGRPFRPEITAIIDVYSRRWVGWSAALAENTWSVADALRHAVTTSTCCDIFYYDNGAGAKNATWDDDVTGIITRLGITKLHSAPWSSQARGVVERFHSTVLHRVARALPTYTGQRMDKEARQVAFKLTRREIAAQRPSKLLMSWPAFLDLIEGARQAYNARPHSSLARVVDPVSGRRRQATPDEAWAVAVAAGWNAEPIAAAEARELFRPAATRIVNRGTVALFNNVYFHAALEPLHGEEVTVAFDIHDAHLVQVRARDGRFVCDAEWNANARDYVPIAFAERARQQRIEGRLRRINVHRDEAIAEGLPMLTLSAIASPPAPEVTAAATAAQAKLEAEFAAPEPAPLVEETGAARFARARRIAAAVDAGEAVAEIDRAWLERYRRLPEFRAYETLYRDFGDDALTA